MNECWRNSKPHRAAKRCSNRRTKRLIATRRRRPIIADSLRRSAYDEQNTGGG